MRLKKFQRNNKKNSMLIIAVAIIVGLVVSTNLIKSHANFSAHKEFNIIQGKIPNPGDVKLAILVGNEKTNTFPNKQDYKYVETKCNEDSHANISFDPNTWKLNIDGIDSKTICTIKFESKNEYEEEILKGSYPVVKDELVPVVIANNGVVTKANIKDEWYSYENSRWANAVILTGTDIYQVGDPIPEEAIESYFVWIPKYRYKLFNVEGNSISPQEIEIEFGINDTVDNNKTECKATNESGNIGTCKDEMWMTHPAFTSLGVNGIWVGKFETTGSTSAPTVKPNVASLRSITGKVMYDTAWSFNRNLDSHMMKNTEWGAMAYLTNSKYGRGNSEVWINNYWNNSQTLTGCTGESVSANNTTTCATPYFNNVAVKEGSTTRNMSGIFDTSGGSWDMIMGNLNNTTSNSGFTSWFASKYYDKYTGDNSSARILGDATQETYGWNRDSTDFVDTGSPWFYRGGDYKYTTGTGVFCVGYSHGGADYGFGFRLVLSPSN